MILNNIIFILHILLLVFAVLGCLLPKKWLILHLLVWPLIIIHWLTNNDNCILTQLEKTTRPPGIEYVHFSLRIKDLLGIKDGNSEEADIDMMRNIYVTGYSITWLISLYRYVYV